MNILNGDYSKAHEKFENDYWTVSLKELAKKIEKNRNLLKEPDLSVKVIKVAFCGVAYSNIKPYLKKIPGIKFKKVDYLYEDYDYIIMTNRTIENSYVNNLTKVETCFDKFKGEDVITVSRRGLVLSTLRKKI